MFLSTTGLSTASSNVQIQIRNVTTNTNIMANIYPTTMTTANFSMAQAIGASNTNNDSHANGQCLMFLTGTALTLGLYLSVL